MHRLFRAEAVYTAVVLLTVFFFLAGARFVAAGETPERIAGQSLTILRDADSVTVRQGNRVLVRYRYAKRVARPRVTEISSPDGVNVPSDLTFAWTIDAVDFWKDAADSGTQIHEKWLQLRIDRRGGSEWIVWTSF